MPRTRMPPFPRQPTLWGKVLLTPLFMAIGMALTLAQALRWLEGE